MINWVLVRFHLVKPFSPPMWLGEPKLAMISVILVHTWHMLPFATVIILAGWTAIPRDIPEAAAVDGAGFFRRLFQIQIPMMLPIINVAVLFGVIFTFTDMTVIYILTRGGPYDTTQVLPSLAFFTGILGERPRRGRGDLHLPRPVLVLVAWLMLRTAHRRRSPDERGRAGAAGPGAKTRHWTVLAAFSIAPRVSLLLDAHHELQAERATSTT